MNEKENEEIAMVRKQYDDAFNYICGDPLIRNPQRAFSIFHKLADEGFAVAGFFCGLMLCMGIGTEKNVDKGKELLKAQEKILGYTTEIVIEQSGLFNELSTSEQLKCIDYWKNNHQSAHALYLVTHLQPNSEGSCARQVSENQR